MLVSHKLMHTFMCVIHKQMHTFMLVLHKQIHTFMLILHKLMHTFMHVSHKQMHTLTWTKYTHPCSSYINKCTHTCTSHMNQMATQGTKTSLDMYQTDTFVKTHLYSSLGQQPRRRLRVENDQTAVEYCHALHTRMNQPVSQHSCRQSADKTSVKSGLSLQKPRSFCAPEQHRWHCEGMCFGHVSHVLWSAKPRSWCAHVEYDWIRLHTQRYPSKTCMCMRTSMYTCTCMSMQQHAYTKDHIHTKDHIQ